MKKNSRIFLQIMDFNGNQTVEGPNGVSVQLKKALNNTNE